MGRSLSKTLVYSFVFSACCGQLSVAEADGALTCTASTSSIVTLGVDTSYKARSSPALFKITSSSPAQITRISGDGFRRIVNPLLPQQEPATGAKFVYGTFDESGLQTVTFTVKGAGNTGSCSATIHVTPVHLITGNIVGTVHGIHHGVVTGYAFDPNYPESPIRIYFRDANNNLVAIISANLACDDRCDAYSGNHRFIFALPPVLLAAKGSNTLTISGLNFAGDNNAFTEIPLVGSPRSYVNPPDHFPPQGTFDIEADATCASQLAVTGKVITQSGGSDEVRVFGDMRLLGTVSSNPASHSYRLCVPKTGTFDPSRQHLIRVFAAYEDLDPGVPLEPKSPIQPTVPNWPPGVGESQQAQRLLPGPSAYSIGTMRYLDNGAGLKVGMQAVFGGSIAEISVNGLNLVNQQGGGRLVSVSLNDGNQYYQCAQGGPGCPYGWNPTLGDDVFNHPTLVLDESLSTNSYVSKAWPVDWANSYLNPSVSADRPILTDVLVDQKISILPGLPVIRLEQTVTHFGSDIHTLTQQQLPPAIDIWAPNSINQATSYDPVRKSYSWVPIDEVAALGDITTGNMLSPNFSVFIPDRWASLGFLSGANTSGLTLYTPGSVPYANYTYYPSVPCPQNGCDLMNVSPDFFNASTYMDTLQSFSYSPGDRLTTVSYLIVGHLDPSQITAIIGQIQVPPTVYDPLAAVDNQLPPGPPGPTAPPILVATDANNSIYTVGGWAFGGSLQVSQDGTSANVEILLTDSSGVQILETSSVDYGIQRTDLISPDPTNSNIIPFPNLPNVNVGWSHDLVVWPPEATKYHQGNWTITVRSPRPDGTYSVWATIPIILGSPTPLPKPKPRHYHHTRRHHRHWNH